MTDRRPLLLLSSLTDRRLLLLPMRLLLLLSSLAIRPLLRLTDDRGQLFGLCSPRKTIISLTA